MIGERRLFAAAAVALFMWTAAIDLAVRRSAGAPTAVHAPAARRDALGAHQPGAPPGLQVPPAPSPLDTRARSATPATVAPNGTPSEPVQRSSVANNASDPTAAGPAPARDAAVTRLVQRWCGAYIRWGANPGGRAAADLRSLSTPTLYSSLATHPPTPAPAADRVPAPIVGGVQTFDAPGGYSAIVDIDADGANVVVDLSIAATRLGPRVSALSL